MRTHGWQAPHDPSRQWSDDLLGTDRPLTSGEASLNEDLVATIQRLSVAQTLVEIRELVRSAARRLTGSDGATFVLRIGEQCYYADEDAISPLWKGQHFPMNTCVSGWVMRNRRPAAIEDVYSDDRIPQAAYRPTFVKSLAMVPIRESDPLGAIGNYWAHRHQPTAREIALLQALANSTALAMEAVQVREGLERTGLEVIDRLALAAEYRDDGTHEHTARVARTSLLLAQAMGLPSDEVSLIGQAAPLHDVGKLAVPDAILLKPGRLSEAEFGRVKQHTTAGAAILTGGTSKVLRLAEEIAVSHHERWDGSGYPFGLNSRAIPVSGRIVALADVFDALTHARPYKSAWSVRSATAEIRRLRGRQFDPVIVDAFMALEPDRLADLSESVYVGAA
jgi:response regulator RpfG family c-di-GMP phosphodiesterase